MSSASPEPPASLRRFLTRAEAATLVGMLLVVFSLYLVWERHALPANMTPIAGSLFVSEGITRTGQTLPKAIRWTLLGCAVACGATLLWMPTPKTRLTLAVVQGVCGLTCFILTLAWLVRFAIQPGILMALIGSALLIYGAIDRFSFTLKPEGAK